MEPRKVCRPKNRSPQRRTPRVVGAYRRSRRLIGERRAPADDVCFDSAYPISAHARVSVDRLPTDPRGGAPNPTDTTRTSPRYGDDADRSLPHGFRVSLITELGDRERKRSAVYRTRNQDLLVRNAVVKRSVKCVNLAGNSLPERCSPARRSNAHRQHFFPYTWVQANSAPANEAAKTSAVLEFLIRNP